MSLGGMAGRARGPGATLAGVLLLASAGACASGGVRLVEGRYVAASSRFSIASPAGEGERWSRAHVDGAVLSFRGRSGGPAAGAALSLLERCGAPVAEPRLLARELLIGLEQREEEGGAAVVVAGAPAWRQAVRATADGRRVELRSVTRVAGDCTTDFVLVAPHVDAGMEADFDAWWRSYRPGPEPAPGEVRG
jgi:hypothetical protein